MNKILISVLITSIFSILIIISIESQFSFYQILIGFLIYILPATFISSFRSAGRASILTLVSILFTYSSFHFQLLEMWIGVLMALLLGLPIFYYRIRKVMINDGHNYQA
jgi:hypothetical protein